MYLTPFKESNYYRRLKNYCSMHQNGVYNEALSMADLTSEFLNNVKFRVVTLNYDNSDSKPSFYVMTKCNLPCNNKAVREMVRNQVYGFLQDEREHAVLKEDKHLLNMFSFFVDLGLRTNEQELTKPLSKDEVQLFELYTRADGKIDASVNFESCQIHKK